MAGMARVMVRETAAMTMTMRKAVARTMTVRTAVATTMTARNAACQQKASGGMGGGESSRKSWNIWVRSNFTGTDMCGKRTSKSVSIVVQALGLINPIGFLGILCEHRVSDGICGHGNIATLAWQRDIVTHARPRLRDT